MRLEISPGLRYVSGIAVKVTAVLGIVHIALSALCRALEVPAPSPLSVALAGAMLFLPGVALHWRWYWYMQGRKARAAGAVLPPQARDALPFNLGTLKTMIDAFENGYTGQCYL